MVVEAARESRQEYHLHEEKKSGVFASGSGIGITIGSRSERNEYQGDGLTENRRRSLVGSSTGDVVVQAQGNVTIAGSDLVSGQDTILVGRNVTLNPGTDRHDSRETYDVKQSGLSMTVSGPAAAVAQTVARAADRDVQSRDPRIAALQGVKAGLMVDNYLAGVEQAKAVDASNAANGNSDAPPAAKPLAFKITATVGSSKSHAENTSQETVQSGSSIVAGKNVYISATGNGDRDAAGFANDGDVKAAGARISGNNITIAAAHDVELSAAESTASNRGQSSGSSVGVGVGFAVGGKQNGVTLEAQASASRGKVDQDSSRYDASQVRAADTLRIESGRDTTLYGAQASGNRVETQIGRNLDITSTQDKETVRIEQQSASAGISVCVPPACVGTPVQGSVSYQRTDVDSDYLSVREQSGLYAGKEGYEVQVKGNTNLTGAVIASAAEAAKNRLVTGTLTTSDLENRAEYSASISGISLSTGDKNTVVVTPNVGMPSGDSAAGVTRSAISPGTIVITDEASQQARTGQDAATTVATLNRDTANANGAIGKIFDQKKEQQQQELSRLAGEVGNQAVGTVSQKLGLADGSPEKMALHAAVGALQASAAGGNALAGAAGAAAGEYVLTQVSDYLERHPELTPGQRNVIQQWAAVVTGGAVGAVVGGGGAAQAGAAAALDGERYNRQLHISTYQRLKQQCLGSSSSECQTINRIGGVRSGMPTEDARIPASKVIENYDVGGKVVSYTLIDAKTNQPTMIMEPLEFNAYRNAPAGTQALIQLSPQYALDFASAGLYSVAGDNDRAMGHVTAGVTSRDYARDVALGVAGVAGALTTSTRPALAVSPSMLDELATNGVKFTPQNVIATSRGANGQIVFLEKGNAQSGLTHIISEHGSQFLQMGISEAEIPNVVMKAISQGRLVGYQGTGYGRPIYEIAINGQPQLIAVTVGSNGYIVGANPRSSVK